MIEIKIKTKNTDTHLAVAPNADFLSCAMTGLFAALPVFLEHLMACLTGAPSNGKYIPGERPRCN